MTTRTLSNIPTAVAHDSDVFKLGSGAIVEQEPVRSESGLVKHPPDGISLDSVEYKSRIMVHIVGRRKP